MVKTKVIVLTFWISLFSLLPKVYGQKVIKIYTDGNGGDTVQQVISILSKELAKSGSYILEVW